jgi:hypothetical protein
MSQKTKLPYPFPLPNRVGQKKTHPLPRHPKPGAQPDVFDIVGSIGVGPYEYKAWGIGTTTSQSCSNMATGRTPSGFIIGLTRPTAAYSGGSMAGNPKL